jgi:protein-tyrosine-phosphatase
MKRILFACVENSNRSQMAEAFGRLYAPDGFEVLSAGSKASGAIHPRAIRFMAELGYDLSTHRSKPISELEGRFDAVITMGCGEDCPWIEAGLREDWALPDPKHLDDAGYRAVRDEIGRRVKALIERLSGDAG